MHKNKITQEGGNSLILIGTKSIEEISKVTLKYGKLNPIACLPFVFLMSLGMVYISLFLIKR